MLKKSFLLLLLSANLHAAPQSAGFTLSNYNSSSRYGVIGLGIATLIVTTIIPDIIKSSSEWDEETQEKITLYCNCLSIGICTATIIYSAVIFASAGRDFYDYSFPSEARKASLKAAGERNKIWEAKNAFRDCLMKNAQLPKNNAGIPTACEKLASTFTAVAGKAACNDMIKNFKNAYQD